MDGNSVEVGYDHNWVPGLSTPKGVNISIYPDGRFSLYRVKFSKGIMPKELLGGWTTYEQAYCAVEKYLDNHKDYVRTKRVQESRKRKG